MIDLEVEDKEKFAKKNIIKSISEKIRNPKRSIKKLVKEQQISERSMPRIIKDDSKINSHTLQKRQCYQLYRKLKICFVFW